MEQPTPKPFPQDKEYELSLLLQNDPEKRQLMAYLDPYLRMVLDRFDLTDTLFQSLYHALQDDVVIAAERYLSGSARHGDYKFSAYFSWYLSERLDSVHGLKEKEQKEIQKGE